MVASKSVLDSTEDLVAMEGRQLSLKTPLSDKSLLSAASQLSGDYYDYYEDDNGLGGLNSKLSGLQKNKGGINKLKGVQQRNGVSKLRAGASNAVGSFSGHSASYSGDEYCDNGVSLALLLTALLGVAVMFYVLYTKITKAGRRKKRSTKELNDLEEEMNPVLSAVENIEDIVYAGLEDFENKVDKIASGQEDDSWISKLYKRLSENFAINDQISPEQHHERFFQKLFCADFPVTKVKMDGLDPPILDETWGLEDFYNKTSEFENHLEQQQNLNETEAIDNTNIISQAEEMFENELVHLFNGGKCDVRFWSCVAKIAAGSSHYFKSFSSLTNAINKNLYKVVFHGGFGNLWGGLMAIPEARKVKYCLNKKDECLSQEILRKEVNGTASDNSRLIVNPEFVESLDMSDGANQFDPEGQEVYERTMEDNEIGL